jgi:prophage maintenance system killer protein
MQDLLIEQIIALHGVIIARDGGDGRLLSEGNLHQMVFRANLMPDTLQRAAFVFFFLIAYPAFREGNKRAARELAARILTEGGYSISPAEEMQLKQMIESILSFTTELQDIEVWFSAHARKR